MIDKSTLHSDIVTALESDNFSLAWVLTLPSGRIQENLVSNYDPGVPYSTPIYLTTHNSDVSVSGGAGDYTAGGHILKIPSISREKEIKLHSVTVTLAGTEKIGESSLYEVFYTTDMGGGQCTLGLVFIDNITGGVIGDQIVDMYTGYFDSWSFQDGGTTETINIKITSSWSKPLKTAGRITNPSAQEAKYEGDRFFEFAHEEKANIGWGKEA